MVMMIFDKINVPELIQIGRIPQSWSCERENTESENMLYMNAGDVTNPKL